MADHERQEDLVRASALDWTIVRPVVIDDGVTEEPPSVSVDRPPAGMRVARGQVSRAIADALDDPTTVGHALSVGRS